jgi:hypothetical protein
MYIYIYIVRYRTQELSCFNITLASFPISVFLNFLLSYSLLLIIQVQALFALQGPLYDLAIVLLLLLNILKEVYFINRIT